jgi:Amt family ammonium transporter
MTGKKGLLMALILLLAASFVPLAAEEPAVVSSDAVAAETDDTGAVVATQSDKNSLFGESLTAIWLLITGAMVFFMQAGFAMVETGLTRAKNAGNILMKNLMDFAVGAVAYLALGWAIMYGTLPDGSAAGKIIGFTDFFLMGSKNYLGWFFQVVFAATAATIVSGAMAERTKFISYLIYSAVISLVIYPVSGHWIWGGGWLFDLGFHDFAGSTVVHSVGGWAALMGALIIGPRIGKYIKVNGKTTVKAIQGHNLPLAALGVFILWFGWYGFNPGSTLNGTDMRMAPVAVTTTLAASTGAIFAMIVSWFMSKKPDVSMSLNGALAGLVAITAPCAVVSPVAALIIGAIAGVLVVLSVEFIDKKLHIDDPVGAISVHGVNGVFGTLAVGLFANKEMADAMGIGTGLFYGGGFAQLGVQALGVAAVFGWVALTAGLLFLIIKKTVGLRVSAKEEVRGLDIGEHGCEAYNGFQIFSNM